MTITRDYEKREIEGKKLNIGCGTKTFKGFVNLDREKFEGIDVVHDLEVFPYPFEDDEFDHVIADGIIEHMKDIPAVLKELHRITKKGGMIEIYVPYFRSESAYADLTHTHYFSYHSFDNLTNEKGYKTPINYSLDKNKLFKYEERKLQFRKTYYFISLIAGKHPHLYETLLSHLFPAGGLMVKLKVIK